MQSSTPWLSKTKGAQDHKCFNIKAIKVGDCCNPGADDLAAAKAALLNLLCGARLAGCRQLRVMHSWG